MKKPNHQRGPAERKTPAPNPPQIQQPQKPKKPVPVNEDEVITDVRDMPRGRPHAPDTQRMTKAPAQAAKVNEEVMSLPQSLPSADALAGKWKQQVGAAKIAWGKLTEDELLKLEGHQDKLAGLVQERYAITRDEAEKQVRDFFDSNRP